MQVYKFGGASIAMPDKMKALFPIINSVVGPILIVVSALGKTTNALETITEKSFGNEIESATNLLDELKKVHLEYCDVLLTGEFNETSQYRLTALFEEIKIRFSVDNKHTYDFYYDQIVSYGELFSSIILYYFMLECGIDAVWTDAREIIVTDETYRDPFVNLHKTKQKADLIIGEHLKNDKIVITQGFIGATQSGSYVTLGREGSDYTAALMASIFFAEGVTIWKDVPGLLNADPKQFENTVLIQEITYREVIEMSFYGAQIIHPKTIKPLQNAGIPLYVKCFKNPTLNGTVIKNEVEDEHYPPLVALKENQVLLQVTTRDFSFITEDNLSVIYALFNDLHIKVNIMQNAAISFVTCIDNNSLKLESLIKKLHSNYKVLINKNVSLLTVRHYTKEIIGQLTQNKSILLFQETRKTVQMVMR